MGTREKLLARAMAGRYGYDRSGYRHADVEVLPRDPFGFGRSAGWQGRPYRPFWRDDP